MNAHSPEYHVGEAHVLLERVRDKQAAASPELSYGLRGRLYASKSGWVLLSVPNALGRGAFDALNEPGIELPEDYNAHISVIRPEELTAAGLSAEKITERGHDYSYTLGPVRTTTPNGWGEMSKVWFIEVNSPELEKLRKSYGLTPLPKDNEFKFHITFAVRRKNVILDRPPAKKAAGVLRELGQLVPAKTAADDDLAMVMQLRQAKEESDRKNYQQKHHILRTLIAQAPQDWVIDSRGQVHGVTHLPTNFRFHIPPEALPAGFDKAANNILGTSVYAKAVGEVPLQLQSGRGLLGNLMDHAGKIKARGDQVYNDHFSAQRLYNAMDPNRGLQQLLALAQGRREMALSNPLDRLLYESGP